MIRPYRPIANTKETYMIPVEKVIQVSHELLCELLELKRNIPIERISVTRNRLGHCWDIEIIYMVSQSGTEE